VHQKEIIIEKIKNMDKIINLGFVLAGKWHLSTPNCINFNLTKFKSATDVLYAFVSNDKLKYLGKTTKTLESRMKGYRKPGPTQYTNIRINGLISKTLQASQEVFIYVLVGTDLCEYKGHKVSLAAGLEDIFIRELNPEWNYHGKKKISTQVEEINEINEYELIMSKNQSSRIISIAPFTKSYLQCNFFNVPKKYSDLFGINDSAIRIEFDNKVIIGRIDRKNVTSGAPRIYCGVEYHQWVNSNYKISDKMEIEIISPISIKLL
jgi:hypothetical protein